MSDDLELGNLPRLINEIELAQTQEAFRADLFAWASFSGRPVKTLKDFMALKSQYSESDHLDRTKILMDFEVALEVLDALDKAKHQNFAFYESLWRFKYTAVLTSQSEDFAIMRSLQDYFGGILIDSKQTPYLLIIPQPDGTYIQIGYESMLQLSENPLGEKRDHAKILAQAYIHSQRLVAEA